MGWDLGQFIEEYNLFFLLVMFEITVLSLAFLEPLLQPCTIQIRSLSSERLQNESSLCSGKHFQWNEKFYCSEEESLVRFQVLRVSSSNQKQRVAMGIYDFINSSEEIVNENQRSIKVFNGESRVVGKLNIEVRYVNGGNNIKRIQTSVTFGNSVHNPNSPGKGVIADSQFSTAYKSRYTFGVTNSVQYQQFKEVTSIPPASRQGIQQSSIRQQSAIGGYPLENRQRITEFASQNYHIINKESGTKPPVYFIKTQDRLKNLFSCFDNCHQQFQLAPALIRN